jgi:hypothetical protein
MEQLSALGATFSSLNSSILKPLPTIAIAHFEQSDTEKS